MTICVAIAMSGMTDQRSGRRIYLDSNAFIYAIEGVGDGSSQLHSLFDALRHQVEPACTSQFTLAEVLPKANAVQRRNYLTLILHSGLFEPLPVTQDILIATAEYRGNFTLASPEVRGSMPKLPDAIHVVTAMQAGCDTFVSSDRDLKLPVGMVRVGYEDGTLLKLVQDLS